MGRALTAVSVAIQQSKAGAIRSLRSRPPLVVVAVGFEPEAVPISLPRAPVVAVAARVPPRLKRRLQAIWAGNSAPIGLVAAAVGAVETGLPWLTWAAFPVTVPADEVRTDEAVSRGPLRVLATRPLIAWWPAIR
jgi:hypothetical protein